MVILPLTILTTPIPSLGMNMKLWKMEQGQDGDQVNQISN